MNLAALRSSRTVRALTYGYLAASFALAVALLVNVWGTHGEITAWILLVLFPLHPLAMAMFGQVPWVVAFVVLFMAASALAWALLKPNRTLERDGPQAARPSP